MDAPATTAQQSLLWEEEEDGIPLATDSSDDGSGFSDDNDELLMSYSCMESVLCVKGLWLCCVDYCGLSVVRLYLSVLVCRVWMLNFQ